MGPNQSFIKYGEDDGESIIRGLHSIWLHMPGRRSWRNFSSSKFRHFVPSAMLLLLYSMLALSIFALVSLFNIPLFLLVLFIN